MNIILFVLRKTKLLSEVLESEVLARAHGWQDTYVFTKATAEMIMVKGREDLPVVIVRPSIIESTYSQPFPGWIEGNR